MIGLTLFHLSEEASIGRFRAAPLDRVSLVGLGRVGRRRIPRRQLFIAARLPTGHVLRISQYKRR